MRHVRCVFQSVGERSTEMKISADLEAYISDRFEAWVYEGNRSTLVTLWAINSEGIEVCES